MTPSHCITPPLLLSSSLGGCAYAPFWPCRGDVYRVFGGGLVRGTGLAIRHHSGYHHDIFTSYATPSYMSKKHTLMYPIDTLSCIH